MYDIICDRWHNVQDSVPKDLNADMARFGHSAVLRNGTMLVHAGFQVHTSFVLLISKNKMEIDDEFPPMRWVVWWDHELQRWELSTFWAW